MAPFDRSYTTSYQSDINAALSHALSLEFRLILVPFWTITNSMWKFNVWSTH